MSCSIQSAATAGQKVMLLCERDMLYAIQDQGKTWQVKRLPAGAKFRDVAFLDSRRGFVIGDNATLLATEDGGDSWRQVPAPTKEHLTAIQFVGDLGWIAGYGGVMLHSTDGGRTWSPQSTGVTQALEGLYFADAQHGWAVGWIGTVVRTLDGGRTWQPVPVSNMAWSMSSVYFRDLQNGWIVGFGGQILRSRDGGATWQAQTSPVSVTLSSVRFDSSSRGWITAGNDMLVSEDGGENWKLLDIPETLFLSQLLRVNDSLWAIGQFGVLKQTADGLKWQKIEKPAPKAG
jgi:photosystem II stability/assembly factor-like uncharacterized protein